MEEETSMDSVKTKNTIDIDKFMDITIKMKMVNNIIKACAIEAHAGKLYSTAINCHERTRAYTKADDYLIYKAKTMKPKNISFTEWEETKIEKPLPAGVRNVYLNAYLNMRKIPMKLPGYFQIKIPNTQLGLLIEEPDRVRRRMQYLSTLAQFRLERKNIIYIEEKLVGVKRIGDCYNFDENLFLKNNVNEYLCMAMCKTGLLKLFFFKDTIYYYYDLILNVLENLKKPSVIILEERSHHEKEIWPLPSPYSTKEAMSQFLTHNDVPHDPETSKAELYELVKRLKPNFKTEWHIIDEIVKAHGHFLLRRPIDSEKLRFMNFFFKSLNDSCMLNKTRGVFGVKSALLGALNETKKEEWLEMERELIDREEKMYAEDLQVEEVIDKILTMARHEKLSLRDFRQTLDFIYHCNTENVLIL